MSLSKIQMCRRVVRENRPRVLLRVKGDSRTRVTFVQLLVRLWQFSTAHVHFIRIMCKYQMVIIDLAGVWYIIYNIYIIPIGSAGVYSYFIDIHMYLYNIINIQFYRYVAFFVLYDVYRPKWSKWRAHDGSLPFIYSKNKIYSSYYSNVYIYF